MPEKICPVCNKVIENASPYRKYHEGECQWIAHKSQIYECKRRKGAVCEKVEQVCKYCKATYSSLASRPAKTCPSKTCKNKLQRERMNNLKNGTPEEKTQYKRIRQKQMEKNKKYQKDSYSLEQEIKTCKCPGCGILHQYVFEPKWCGNPKVLPRIGCPRYPHCVNGPEIIERVGGSNWNRYPETYETSWQTDRGAMI